MKFIVLGSGLTGFQLAKRLSGAGNDVVLIDDNPDAARLAEARLDCMVIQAKGNDLGTLERAGLSQADALIALTSSDEVNMIACAIADAACPSLLKIARVRNDDYYPAKGEKDAAVPARPVCGIDFMVQPEREAADVICDTIFQGAVNDALQFEESNFLLVSITVAHGSTLDGARVQDVRRLTKKSFIICCIETENEAFIPSGKTILESGERVGVLRVGILTDRNSLSEIFRLAGFAPAPIRKTTVIGAGRTGSQIVERLLEHKERGNFGKLFMPFRQPSVSVSIIDKDKEQYKLRHLAENAFLLLKRLQGNCRKIR